MVKRIIREDEERDHEETQDFQRSIESILHLKHFQQLSDFTKFQSPRFIEISLILTAPHRHFSSLNILSSFFCKANIFACYLECLSISDCVIPKL